ncbi:oxidoreductase-like domain-containing protein [Novilysobacter concretionis]|uniref:oxidoreductase-like domain-containing protein n=1 Tax=Novilysobacter concretionis TaxID=262325 RepID=UPI003CCCCFE6
MPASSPLIPIPSVATEDPPPLRPERPLPMDCCDSGCDPCVHDLYAEEMEHYEALLAAWRARNPGREPG